MGRALDRNIIYVYGYEMINEKKKHFSESKKKKTNSENELDFNEADRKFYW